jgi:predicted nucleic acid-binding protein
MGKEIVADTSAILDIIIRSRPRHKFAKAVGMYLIDNQVKVTVPMHALFEIRSAILNAKLGAAESQVPIQINEDISESTPLFYNPIPIDDKFFNKYFIAEISDLKAGDYMYVALAKVEKLDFLTEDIGQYNAAKLAGVAVYNLEEYRAKIIQA